MKYLIPCLVLAAASVGVGIAVNADAAVTGNQMATLVCRPAASDEKAYAQESDGTNLVCKPWSPKVLMAAKTPMSTIAGGKQLWQQMYDGIILGRYAL